MWNSRRTNLGPQFSEGARQLWLALARLGWSQTKARANLGVAAGMLSRWLFGDRKPDIDWANKIQVLFGVEQRLWSEPPAEPFEPNKGAEPPATRAA